MSPADRLERALDYGAQVHPQYRAAWVLIGMALDNVLLALAIGATEYAAEHFVEHGEGGVRESRFHLACENDQSGQPSRRIEPREMLGAQNGGLPRDCRVARAVNSLFPIRALDPSESPPAPMLAFVARQVGVDPALFGEYARRAETRREHVLELQKLLRLLSFGLADWRACLRVGTDAAWATDRGEPIVQAMLAYLRTSGVLLPAAAVLERIGLAARARARKKTFEAIASGMSESERDTLTGLLAVDPELRRSRFAWLRDYSESPAGAGRRHTR